MASTEAHSMSFSPRGIRVEAEQLVFEQLALRHFLPHRGRMLLLDRVRALSSSRREILAVKYLSQNDPSLTGPSRAEAHFSQGLLVESLAQACGFLMNVLHVLRVNQLSPLELADEKLEGQKLVPAPLSVLAECKIRQHALARPAEVVEVHARVSAQRGDMWYFSVSARTERELADGEILLAYPSYMASASPNPSAATDAREAK
jgi:3-hydroxymyristoyl/3-hydroxydecanoyl-(acyl carrier protein) dehydratase